MKSISMELLLLFIFNFVQLYIYVQGITQYFLTNNGLIKVQVFQVLFDIGPFRQWIWHRDDAY